MKALHAVEIDKTYAILFDVYDSSDVNRNRPWSLNMVKIYDHTTDKTHYSEWNGSYHGADLLPDSPNYLGTEFNESVEELGKRMYVIARAARKCARKYGLI